MTSRIAILALLAAAWSGCGEDGSTSQPGDGGPDSGTDTDTETSTDFDCADLPQGPFELIPTVGTASKDVAFDDEGNLVGSDIYIIYKTNIDGVKDEIVDDIPSCTGVRYLPDGNLVYAEEMNGKVVLVDVDGQHEVLHTLLSPRGLAVDEEGLVYVADPPMNRIKRVDPYNFEEELVLDGLEHVAALSFDVGYDRLFIATEGEVDSTIYFIEIGSDGTPGELQTFATDVGDGWHVGLGVDACGNVYVVEQQCDGEMQRSCVRRISADGVVEDEPIAELESETLEHLGGLEWGSGIGGWSQNSLFLGQTGQDKVFRLDIGVPSKPRVFP